MFRRSPRQLLIGAMVAFTLGLASLAATSSTAELRGGLLADFSGAGGSAADEQANANATERCANAAQGIANANESAAEQSAHASARSAAGGNATVDCHLGDGSSDAQQDPQDLREGSSEAGDDVDDNGNGGADGTSITKVAANNPDGHCLMLPSVSNVISAPDKHSQWDVLGGDCPPAEESAPSAERPHPQTQTTGEDQS